MSTTLNNIALCYHGITTNLKEKSNYVSYLEDFEGQINHLLTLGYHFVKPSVFYITYNSTVKPIAPIATIMFDDALKSSNLATQWLASKSIPYGIVLIGERLCKLTPQEGYLTWQELRAAVNSGLCEILHHTYNLHSFCLVKEGSNIVTTPILEAPCYIDKGEFIYIAPGDNRWYWDMMHINKTSWGFPLFGTDTLTGQKLKSTIKFKASSTILASQMRVWACLHNPYGSGYSAQVQVKINGTLVTTSTVKPVNYGARTQWPERELVTIPFTSKYQITGGNSYTIEITTQNIGNASFLIYAVPDFSGNFSMSTTCSGMTFNANIQWPARACIILADSTGTIATSTQYKTYINEDLNQNNQVIKKYLNTTWKTRSTGYVDSDSLSAIVLGGTYTNGLLADTKIKFHANESFTSDILRFKNASKLGSNYPLIIDVYINEVKVARFESNWSEWYWQEIEIDSYNFIAGNDYTIRFETKNKSPYGLGLVRLYMDQPKPPQPAWDAQLNSFVAPPATAFAHAALYEVANTEGTDVYPDGVAIDNKINYHYVTNTPFDGPGKAFLEILGCTSGTASVPTQICYPFGSYYSSITTQNKEDVHPDLKAILNGIGVKSGYGVWDNPVSSLIDINLKYSEYIMPRYLIEGVTPQTQVIQNIDIFIGNK